MPRRIIYIKNPTDGKSNFRTVGGSSEQDFIEFIRQLNRIAQSILESLPDSSALTPAGTPQAGAWLAQLATPFIHFEGTDPNDYGYSLVNFDIFHLQEGITITVPEWVWEDTGLFENNGPGPLFGDDPEWQRIRRLNIGYEFAGMHIPAWDWRNFEDPWGLETPGIFQ